MAKEQLHRQANACTVELVRKTDNQRPQDCHRRKTTAQLSLLRYLSGFLRGDEEGSGMMEIPCGVPAAAVPAGNWLRLLDAAGLTARHRQTFFGRPMQVHLPDLVGVKLYQYGFFEEGLTRAIIERLQPSDTFVDIAAHVGYYACWPHCWWAEDMSSFELTPRTRGSWPTRRASAICRSCRWPPGTQPNVSRCKTSAGGNQASTAWWRRASTAAGAESIEVEAVAVDDWLEPTAWCQPHQDDAESAEQHVLRGLRRTIEQHHRSVARDRRLRPARCAEFGRTHPLDHRAGI